MRPPIQGHYGCMCRCACCWLSVFIFYVSFCLLTFHVLSVLAFATGGLETVCLHLHTLSCLQLWTPRLQWVWQDDTPEVYPGETGSGRRHYSHSGQTAWLRGTCSAREGRRLYATGTNGGHVMQSTVVLACPPDGRTH